MSTRSAFVAARRHCRLDVLLKRIKEEVRRLQRRHQLKLPTNSDQSDEESGNAADSRPSAHQQHLLTLKQVNLICARLLQEREEKIREEYDRILTSKLNGTRTFPSPLAVSHAVLVEQYEGFVRFTQDQLTRRFSELQFSCESRACSPFDRTRIAFRLDVS